MANWENYTVEDAVRKIDSGEWQLPVIQRDFVWPKDKIILLFDTLLKKDPFGGIMAYVEECGNKPLFAHRQFSKNGGTNDSYNEVDTLHSDRVVIIDGQQRLQSMYLALRGDLHGEILFFDILNPTDSEQYHFLFSNNTDQLPKDQLLENGVRVPSKWVSLLVMNDEYQKRRDSERLSKRLFELLGVNNEEQKGIVRNNISCFCTAIFTERAIGIAKLFLDKDESEIHRRMRMVELFRRLNDGGTKLSGMDLIASQIKAYNWQMETKLRRIDEEYSDINYDSDSFIKLSLVINGKPKADIDSFENVDAAFLTSNFDRIEMSLRAYIKFLKVSGYYSFIKSKKTRIPGYIISSYFYYTKCTITELENYFDNFDTQNTDFNAIKKWLAISLLNSFFSRGCGWIPEKTGLDKLFQVIKTNAGKPFPLNALLYCYQSYPRLTLKLPSKECELSLYDRDTVFKLLYGEIYSLREEDIDHIHPRSIMFGKYPLITNRIENYQLIDFETNRNIKRAKPFKEWFNDSVLDELKKDYLERNLIPDDKDLWEYDNFPQFIEARKSLINKKLIELFE